MKEKIAKICKNIEKEKNIKVLFAVENGSRAWKRELFIIFLLWIRTLNHF